MYWIGNGSTGPGSSCPADGNCFFGTYFTSITYDSTCIDFYSYTSDLDPCFASNTYIHPDSNQQPFTHPHFFRDAFDDADEYTYPGTTNAYFDIYINSISNIYSVASNCNIDTRRKPATNINPWGWWKWIDFII